MRRTPEIQQTVAVHFWGGPFDGQVTNLTFTGVAPETVEMPHNLGPDEDGNPRIVHLPHVLRVARVNDPTNSDILPDGEARVWAIAPGYEPLTYNTTSHHFNK